MIAKKYYSQYEESELKMIGMDVKLLDIIKYTQSIKGKKSIEFEYYLSCCDLEGASNFLKRYVQQIKS
jgi:hypothetical protein